MPGINILFCNKNCRLHMWANNARVSCTISESALSEIGYSVELGVTKPVITKGGVNSIVLEKRILNGIADTILTECQFDSMQVN